MAQRHQHGVTNKNLGRNLIKTRLHQFIEGELYYCAIADPVNGSIIHKHFPCTATEAQVFHDHFTNERNEYTVICRPIHPLLYPCFGIRESVQ